MADSIGPNQYQGGISGGNAPQVNRYDTQVDMQGTPLPANAHGQHIISGFGEAAPGLAKSLDVAGEIAQQLWLEQQKSAAQLFGRQTLAHAAATAQPGQSISQTVNKGVGQFNSSLVSAANTPQLKASLSSELAPVAGQIQAQGRALDQGQAWNNAMSYFDQTLANKEKIYGTLAYDHIDGQLSDDLGGINSRITRLPLPQDKRVQMQEEMMTRLTNAANAAKVRLDPDRYLAKDAVELPPQPADTNTGDAGIEEADTNAHPGALSYIMGTADQRQQWRQDALRARDGRIADAAQAAQQQAAAYQQAHRNAINALVDKYSGGQLTSRDVLDSGLPPAVQQQAIGMMARGPDAQGNPAQHGQLFIQAVSGNIADGSQLLPSMVRPDGINPAQAQNVAAAIQLANEPYVKRFVVGAQGHVTGPNGSIADPDGDRQFSNLLMDLQSQLADGRKRGLSPRDLLDPESKYYVGDRLVNAYARSPFEKLAALNRAQRESQASLRQTDETGNDYIARTIAGKVTL